MECMTWSEKDWQTLLHTIRHKNCLLMLGPDAALAGDDDRARPLTELLALELSSKLKADIRSQIDCSNLTQVAQYYRMEAGRNDLEAEVDAFYEQRRELSSELHENLAVFPFHFIITSTPDRMLFNALQKAGKAPQTPTPYYHFRGENPEMVRMGAEESPLIYQLYGSLEKPGSLVLTENNLLDFLAAVIAKDPPLPHNVLSELRDRNKSLLFLGFGFKHWYLRILLHVLQGRDKDSRSFALEQYAPGNVDEFQRTILFFRMSDYKITICAKELRTFVRELRARYAERPAAHTQELDLSHAPTVFLCHSKDNRSEAEYLRDRLKADGFNAWFDEENLRGGDEWDRTIERAIKKEIDYFVVLQSKAMTTKNESYFHKEIRLALERQNYFRPGIRFIIPAKIDDCPLLEELEHLQTIDLAGRTNIEKLISTIKRDQQRRKKK